MTTQVLTGLLLLVLPVAYDPLSEGRLGGRRHPHLAAQQAELERAP